MIAAIALLICLALAGDDEPEALLAGWEDSLELGLPTEVLERGPELVGPDGPLAANGAAVALVARALFLTGEERGARALLENAQPDDSTRPEVELARAWLHLELDELEEALRLLAPAGKPLVPRHADRPAGWLILGRALSRSGREAEADPLLLGFLERAPLAVEAPSAWHMLAQHAIRRRDLDTARGYREKSAETGRWQSYYRARRMQIRDAPRAPLPRLGLAKLWMSVDELDRARAVLEELVELAPNFCPAWSHLGEVARKRDQLVAAREYYDRALDCDATDVLTRYNRGMLCLVQGSTDQARADFEHVVGGEHEADARFLRAHLLLARILNDAGEAAAARERHARYRELGGEDEL